MRPPTPVLKNLPARGLLGNFAARAVLGNFAARAVLALTLLFAQQTAALHWLSHAIEATSAKADSSPTPAHHCDECLTLSALGAAAAGGDNALPLAAAQHALLSTPLAMPSPAAPWLAFRSRAPPTLI